MTTAFAKIVWSLVFVWLLAFPLVRTEAQENPPPTPAQSENSGDKDAEKKDAPASPTNSEKAAGKETPSPQKASEKNEEVSRLLERLDKVNRELVRLKGGNAPPNAKIERAKKVYMVLENPYLGVTSARSPQGVRFFVARLYFVNLTDEPITVTRDAIQLSVDGKSMPITEFPLSLRNFSFQLGDESILLRNLQTLAEVKVAPGNAGSTWVVFANLPAGTNIPTLVLRATINGVSTDLDVNEFERGILGMQVERIGPRHSLVLLTISGDLGSVNLKNVVDELEKASTDKIARAVIRWVDSAGAVDSQLLTWLEYSAMRSGRAEMNESRFPAIPATIRELHLAAVPNQGARRRSGRGGRDNQNIHANDSDAVTAALQSAYDVLPADELLAEIQKGHPLSRAAALAEGGGRLPTDKLPLILNLAGDADPKIQRAAVIALRNYGEPEAVAKLIEVARGNVNQLATTAVESLAASRFAAAHEGLLAMLKTTSPESKKRIVEILARYPRPIWSEAIYEFAVDPASGVGVVAMRSLVRIGHPRLVDVLKQALKGSDNALSAEAFRLLATRTDPESQSLVVEFTLEHMKQTSPTPQMVSLLTRAKDPRAVPLLLKLLEKQGENRAALINALASLGDESVAEVLTAKYPVLRNHEKTAALNALLLLRSDSFRKFAGEALLSSDNQLVSAACRGLLADGGPEAVALLIKALAESKSSVVWSPVTNALSLLATPDARTALREARDSGISGKRDLALRALRNIWQRSPGYTYIVRGQEFMEQEKWKPALEQFSEAIKIDAELPDAYAGRANTYIKQEKFQEAKDDFKRSIELDPYNSVAVAGMGIALVGEGKFEEGVRFVEDARGRFPRDPLFAYNAACVYSLAFGHVKDHQQIEGRDEKLEDYKDKAIAELNRCVKLRFNDFDWMKRDPDLKPLHDLPEFQKIVSQKP